MPEMWIILLTFGAAARITRLINCDMLTEPLRNLVARIFGEDSTPHHFIKCPWCVGFWTSLAVAPLAFCPKINHHPAFLIITLALCMSWLIGLVARNLDPQD